MNVKVFFGCSFQITHKPLGFICTSNPASSAISPWTPPLKKFLHLRRSQGATNALCTETCSYLEPGQWPCGQGGPCLCGTSTTGTTTMGSTTSRKGQGWWVRLGRCLRLSDEGHDGMNDRYMMHTAYRWMMDRSGLMMAFNFPVSFRLHTSLVK